MSFRNWARPPPSCDPHTGKTTLDCSHPTPFSLSFGSAPLQHPNTELNGTFTTLAPGGAYCWRLVATVTTGVAAGTYYGNWQYFATTGTYIQNFEPAPYQPPPAQPLEVAQCSSDGSGCQTSNCTTSNCTTTGGLSGLGHTVAIALAGTGGGKVTGAGGISCPGTCSRVYPAGATDKVTLSAAANPGSSFTGWSGGGCSGTGTCTVSESADQSVTATFTATVVVVKPSCSLAAVSSRIALRKRRRSPPVDTLVISVKCTQAVSARVSGTVSEQLSGKHTKGFKLGPATATLAAGVKHTIDLKLPASERLPGSSTATRRASRSA